MFIGIDPGQSGAIAFVEDVSKPIRIVSMPVRPLNKKKVEINPLALYNALSEVPTIKLACIEDVNANPGFGAAASFTFGKGFGMVIAVLELLEIPYIRVKPQEWKSQILKGTDRSKEAAISYIQQRFPGINLIPPDCENPSHDWAEAMCMALCAKMRYQ